MSDFKEFQGKDLDEAIENACDYFNLKRERLEIEILGGGSSGIFGIMGVKKAKVKARPRGAVNATDILSSDDKAEKQPRPKAAPKREPKQEKPVEEAAPEQQEAVQEEPQAAPVQEQVEEEAPAPRKESKPRGGRGGNKKNDRKPRERKPREQKPREKRAPAERTERPRANLAEMDQQVLEKSVHEVMNELLVPIIGEKPNLDVTIETDRIKIFIDDEENSGLIIGREGQTLSSIQYLVNRLVSRQMQASVRIQVDTGDYRERQDDKLRQIAWHLADKADNLGRTQSTKPLSSYHRRVVHLALQDNETVITRSKGDGPMKRVLIVPKSRQNGNRARRRD